MSLEELEAKVGDTPANIQANAASKLRQLRHDPPATLSDLVESLSNLCVNKDARIRDLETHIRRLTGLS